MTMEIEGFSLKYLQIWDKRSTVRHLERFQPTARDVASQIVPDNALPFSHSINDLNLSGEAVRWYAAMQCYRFMEEIALVESDVIVRLCNLLANRQHDWHLPFAARQVAMTIATDESYHALVAREFMENVQHLTGFKPNGLPGRCAVDVALEGVQSHVTESLWNDFQIIALCLAENAIVDELVGLARDTEPDNAFHCVLSEHMLDEGRHRKFFQQLLKFQWAALDPTARDSIARVLPTYLDLWLARDEPMEDALEDLEAVGASSSNLLVLKRKFLSARSGKHDNPMWQNVRNALRVAGMDTNAYLQQQLIIGGWLIPSNGQSQAKP